MLNSKEIAKDNGAYEREQTTELFGYCEFSAEGFVKLVEEVQIDSFKAGAKWAANQIKLGNSLAVNNTGTWLKVNQDFENLADIIISSSSNLKEIPK